MGVGDSLRRFRNLLSEFGIGELIRFAPEYLSELVRHKQDSFDTRYGTDTNRSVPVSDLDGTGVNQDSAEMYWPAREGSFRQMMKSVDLPLDMFVFIDLGAGKGRALILAAEQRFKRVVGVEFSGTLCDVAESNLGLFRKMVPAAPPTEVICQDATTYEFPKEPLLIFLFDPFGPAVLKPVLERLMASLRSDPRPCRIAYYLPMHREVFEQAGFQVLAEERRNLRMVYPWLVMKAPSSPDAFSAHP